MQHRNALLTPTGRLRMVQLVEAERAHVRGGRGRRGRGEVDGPPVGVALARGA